MRLFAKFAVLGVILFGAWAFESYILSVQQEAAAMASEAKSWPVCEDEIWKVTMQRYNSYRCPAHRPSIKKLFNQAYAEHLKTCQRGHTAEKILKREFGIDHFSPDCDP